MRLMMDRQFIITVQLFLPVTLIVQNREALFMTSI